MSDVREAAGRLGHGVTTAVQVLVVTLVWFTVGRVLDLVAGTGPWLTFLGAALGVWIGMLLAWRRAREEEQSHDEAAPAAAAGTGDAH